MIEFMLLLIFAALSKSGDKFSFIYFVGGDSEMSFCQEAQKALNSSQNEFCITYAKSFDYSCNQDDKITLRCENDYNGLKNIPNNIVNLILPIGSVTKNINLDFLKTKMKVLITNYQQSNVEGTCKIDRSVSISGKYKVLFSSITIKNLNIESSEYSVETYQFILISCSKSTDTILSSQKMTVDGCSCNNFKNVANLGFDEFRLDLSSVVTNNIVVTFKEDSTEMIVDGQIYITPKAIFPILLCTQSEKVTFKINLDKDNWDTFYFGLVYTGELPAKIKYLPFSGSFPTNGHTKYGLLLHVNPDQVTYDLTSELLPIMDFFVVNANKSTILKFYGTEEEMSKCKSASELLKTDVEQFCEKYGEYASCSESEPYYSLECSGNFEYNSNTRVFEIVIGSINEMDLDLTSVSLNNAIYIYSFDKAFDHINNRSQITYCRPITKKVNLVGGNMQFRKLSISNLTFKIVDNDLEVSNSVSLYNCINEYNGFNIKTKRIYVDWCTGNLLPINSPVVYENLACDLYQSRYGYIDVIFTKDRYKLRYINKDYDTIEIPIPYSCVNALILYAEDQYYTFIVEDPNTSKFAPLILDTERIEYHFKSKGEWKYPLSGKINITLMCYNKPTIETHSVNLSWFAFNMDIKEKIVVPEYKDPAQQLFFYGNRTELRRCQGNAIYIGNGGIVYEDADYFGYDITKPVEYHCGAPTKYISFIPKNSLNLLISLSSPDVSFDLSYVPVNLPVKIFSINNSTKSANDKVALIGKQITSFDNLYIERLRIKIMDHDFEISNLSLLYSEIDNNDYLIKATKLVIDGSSLANINDKTKLYCGSIIVDIFFSGNCSISFTDSKWKVISNGDCGEIPYNMGNILFLNISNSMPEGIVFDVKDNTNCVLKSVGLIGYNKSLLLYQSGIWSSPLIGPLKVFMNKNEKDATLENDQTYDSNWIDLIYSNDIDFTIPPSTPEYTDSSSPTLAPTSTETPSPTSMPTSTETPSLTSMPTSTETPSPTSMPTSTETPSLTSIPTSTEVPLPTSIPTSTETPSLTSIPTSTETPSPTSMPTSTETPSLTSMPTSTEVPLPTSIPTSTETPSLTSMPTSTEVPLPTSMPTSTETPSLTSMPTSTDASTPASTPESTETPQSTPAFTPSSTPIPDAIYDDTIIINQYKSISISSSSSASKEIEDALSSSGWDEDKDHVVSIDSNILEYNVNLSMKENQYIAPSPGTKINVDDGNLNIVLSPNQKPVTIVVDTSKDASLSIKGGGNLEIQPKDESLKKLSINTKSEIDAPLDIQVQSNVESLYIKSFNLHQSKTNSPLTIQAQNKNKETIPIIVDDLKVQPKTVADLSSISISQSLSVTQSSKLTIDNVDFKEADLVVKMLSFENIYEPMLQGNLNEIPKSFSVVKSKEGNPPENEAFTLIKGDFNCEQWKDKLDISETGFNNKKCSSVDKFRLLGSNQIQELAILNNGENNNKSKGGLKGGIIAAIAIGCVAMVVIIALVIFFVVRHKRNRDLSKYYKTDSDTLSISLIQ